MKNYEEALRDLVNDFYAIVEDVDNMGPAERAYLSGAVRMLRRVYDIPAGKAQEMRQFVVKEVRGLIAEETR